MAENVLHSVAVLFMIGVTMYVNIHTYVYTKTDKYTYLYIIILKLVKTTFFVIKRLHC